MIDLLLIVLSFAFVPIGIILMFIGCFYCFMFIQYCATYNGDEESETRSNDSRRTGRHSGGFVEGTPTPSAVVTIINEARGGRHDERAPSRSPRTKRVNTIGSCPVPIVGIPTGLEEHPPPPYHTVCFTPLDNNVRKKESPSRRNSSV